MIKPTAATQILGSAAADAQKLFVVEEDTQNLDGSELVQEALPGNPMALIVHSPDATWTVDTTCHGTVDVQGTVTRQAEESYTLTPEKTSIEVAKMPLPGTLFVEFVGDQGGVNIKGQTITARADSTLPLRITIEYKFTATRILYTPPGDLDSDPEKDEWTIDLVFTR